MLRFKEWMYFYESVSTDTISIHDAMNAFLEPKRQYEVNASTLVDGKLCEGQKPFIYLASIDKVFVGKEGEYHRDIIQKERSSDLNLASNLQRAYETSYGGDSMMADLNAVGRIGYRVNYDILKKRLPLDNVKKMLSKEKEVSDSQAAIHIFTPSSAEHKSLFNQIDIIAIYSGVKTPINVAARAVKLIFEDSDARRAELDKTIVMFDKNAHLGESFVSHASVPADKKDETPSKTRQQSIEYSRKFGSKPKTMSQASYMYGIPMGDWINLKGKKYNG